MKKNNVISLTEYRSNIENQLLNVLEDATYSELSNYISLLPSTYSGEETLYYWGVNYINEYYKLIGKISNNNDEKTEELKYKIYILYTKENYYAKSKLSYKEFITFSKLLNITFSEYNPSLSRKNDKHPYKCVDKEIEDIVNSVINEVNHRPRPHAYEVPMFKLKILLEVLNDKSYDLLNKEFKSIDLDDKELNNLLSEERIKELKKKQENI